MGMSSRVEGFVNADDTWNKNKAVWDACVNAGVSVPDDIIDFFEGENPGSKPGMTVPIDVAVTKLSEDMLEIFQVDLSKVPKHISVIRFVNSY